MISDEWDGSFVRGSPGTAKRWWIGLRIGDADRGFSGLVLYRCVVRRLIEFVRLDRLTGCREGDGGDAGCCHARSGKQLPRSPTVHRRRIHYLEARADVATRLTDGPRVDEGRAVGSASRIQVRGHHPDRLARALGWDLDRLETAVEEAAGPLAAVGLVIHTASSGLLLRPAVDLSETQARLDALQDDDEGLTQGPARVLFASYMGKLSATADRQDHHFYLGRLHNLGVLVDDRASNGGRHDLSSDFSFCLDF